MPHRLPLAALAAACALLVAACGGNDDSASSTPAPSAASTTSSPVAGSSSATTVRTTSGSLGPHLVDGAGRTLYLWEADSSSTSTCDGACASAWPPLTAKGTPQAAGGARQSLLGTSARSDGSREVTYDGHPLYYYAGDSSPGQANGQGSPEFGAPWWVVSPAGAAVQGDG